ncbi:PREDICTED: uncharacterized protein LOC109205183 [Nicotiana attenuata]|uniref:uncharacterized protein LOC109205183 n=1 Tax=Nicotiana attenuata TaxID=49451 RepID=UPI000905106C|nr:PREDICTED: uncharacterized protein LOC109205183 [Nicotiana attenuata]
MEVYTTKSHNLNRSSSFSSSFSCRSSSLLTRPASPNRVNLCRPVIPSSFSSTSTGGSISVHRREPQQNSGQQNHHQKTKGHCMCAPTNHPGSFRCSLHKNSNQTKYGHINTTTTKTRSHQHLNLNIMRRSAMVNSLVRIGAVEDGELIISRVRTIFSLGQAGSPLCPRQKIFDNDLQL